MFNAYNPDVNVVPLHMLMNLHQRGTRLVEGSLETEHFKVNINFLKEISLFAVKTKGKSQKVVTELYLN